MDAVVALRTSRDGDSDSNAASPEMGTTAAHGRVRGRLRLVLGVLVVAAAALLAWPWLVDRWTHVTIDDSRIGARLVAISSEVTGRVTAVHVVAGDTVTQGQLLAGIDRQPTLLQLQALDARLSGVEAEQEQLRGQQDLIRAQLAARMAAGRSEVRRAQAAHQASQVVVDNARSRLRRASSLAARRVASQQVLEEAQANLATAEQQALAAATGVETARAQLAVIQSEEAQIAVLDRQIAALEAQKKVIHAQREEKRVDLDRREIRADFDGVVDSTFVDAGEYVSPGTRLLIYHDPASVWVDANVKETDFGRLRIGGVATIAVDAYPQLTFSGMITHLGEAATSQLALLPSPNPSGNFTKITQRLPIRVSIEQREGLLRPGMMVELSIDVD